MRTVSECADYARDVEIVSSQDIWHGHVLAVKNDVLRLRPGARVIAREYVDHPGAVGIVALKEGEGGPYICLVSQYRHPVRRVLWEIPAGLCDVAGEGDLAAAQRELAEEASLQASTWNILVDMYTSPGGSNEGLRLFLARDVSPCTTSFVREDEEEEMEAVWISLDDAYRCVMEGKITNPSAVVGIVSTVAALQRGFEGLRDAHSVWVRKPVKHQS